MSNAFNQFMSDWSRKSQAAVDVAQTAVLDAPVEALADFLDDSNGRLGHFLQTSGASLIGREVLTDDEHGGEASTPIHRARCYRCAREYELFQR